MVKFSLKIRPVRPRRSNTGTNSNVVEKDKYGVVIEECDNSSTGVVYKVLADNITYNIHSDAFNCKGKRRIYAKDSNGKWFQYDRVILEDRRAMPSNYITFKPGLGVKGNIVSVNNELLFKIKIAYNVNDAQQCAQALVE